MSGTNMGQPVGSPGGSGNIPNTEPRYKISVKLDGKTEIVVFKTAVTMELAEQVKRIANLALLTLITFGGALMDKNIRKEWKTAIEGKHYSRLKIEKEFVPDYVIQRALQGIESMTPENFQVSFKLISLVATRMEVMRKIKMYGKEEIEIKKELATPLMNPSWNIPDYHVEKRENSYYLVKDKPKTV